MDDKGLFSKEELKSRQDGNELDLSLCSIIKVPVKQISALPKVTVLDLACNKISELPDSFCSLVNLTQIDLSKNCLISLPAGFGSLKNLKRLDLYSNDLVSLPFGFGELHALKWLDLKDNPLQTDLPQIVGDCLEPKDCESCARRMLNFMREMKAQEDKRRQAEVEKDRRKKAEEDQEIRKVNELRKREKKEEKEMRRKAYIEEQKIREDLSRKTAETVFKNGDRNQQQPYQEIDMQRKETGHQTFRNFLRFLMVIGAGAIIFYFYKDALKLVFKDN